MRMLMLCEISIPDESDNTPGNFLDFERVNLFILEPS
jgi:hypothetical protein